MTKEDDPIALAARRWFGYGRWDSSYWFIGMEPGGADNHASYEAWMQLGGGELIDCRQHHLATRFSKWHAGNRRPTQPTWRRLIQLLLGYEGKRADLDAVSLYQRDNWGVLNGETALLEVSALHAKSSATSVNRNAYRDERIATLRQRLKEFRPKFVVFYGKEYTSVYETIADARFDQDGCAWHGSTLCVLVLHPTGRNIPTEMRSGEWWATKGREMRAFALEGSSTVLARGPANLLTNPRAGRAQRRRTPATRESGIEHNTKPLPSDVIRLLASENPKRGGSKSRLRFDCYRDRITVAEYERAVRQRLGEAESRICKDDLKFDSDPRRRYIRLERNGKPVDLNIPAWLRHP